MKTKRTALLLIFASFICITACTTTRTTTYITTMAQTAKENRKVGSFRKISAESGFDVYFTQSNSKSLRVEVENVEIEKVITAIEGETLTIKWKGEKFNRSFKKEKQSVKVYVSAPVLEGIIISGGSDFYIDDLKSKSFQISASGGSDAHIGNLTVAGTTEIASSGGTDCNIKNLKTNHCKLASSGGSDLNIGLEVSGNLSVAASGGADIRLSGKANQVSVAASGGSDIFIKGLTYNQLNSNKTGGSDIHK